MKEDTTFRKKSDNIFAQIILEQTHLNYVNEQLEEIYDKIGEFTEEEDATIFFLNNEKTITINKIQELKIDYANTMKEENTTVSGKIEIDYENIPDEIRWDMYHYLNKLVLTVPGFSYKTVDNQMKYSKDFTNENK